jgi:branched-chain amino acid transport system substrate-binding protein
MSGRRLVAGAALAAALPTLLGLAGCGPTEHDTAEPHPSPTASAADCQHYLAYVGPASGVGASFGADVMGGIRLALSEADGSGLCLRPAFDTGGDASHGAEQAAAVVKDTSVIGVVGPSLSLDAVDAGPVLSAAGVPMISPSASTTALAHRGWRTWHRLVGNDDAQGRADAQYLEQTLHARKVVVIDDQTPYGSGLGRVVWDRLGDRVAGSQKVHRGQTRFPAVVREVRSAAADAVFYAGYGTEAGHLVRALRDAGWSGTFMSGGGADDPSFISAAGGPAANGAILTAAAGPPQRDFAANFFALNDRPAGVYSAHAYDATRIYLAALEAGKESRSAVNRFVGHYRGEGLGGPIAFDSRGDLRRSVMFAFTVLNGAIDIDHATAIR